MNEEVFKGIEIDYLDNKRIIAPYLRGEFQLYEKANRHPKCCIYKHQRLKIKISEHPFVKIDVMPVVVRYVTLSEFEGC